MNIQTMVTMFRSEKSLEQNINANNKFKKFLKKNFPDATIQESVGFWQDYDSSTPSLEPGFTISNINLEELDKIREVVANTKLIGIKGHDQHGFIEIINDKVNSYRLENNEFKLCNGEHQEDWGFDLEFKLDFNINQIATIKQNLEQKNIKRSFGGTILNNNVICLVNSEDKEILESNLESEIEKPEIEKNVFLKELKSLKNSIYKIKHNEKQLTI